MCEKNIKSAWRDVGLFLFNPDIILLKIKPLKILVSRLITTQGPLIQPQNTTPALILLLPLNNKTPYNLTEVTNLLKAIKIGQVNTFIKLEKLAKAT